jgi:hypothetical protein
MSKADELNALADRCEAPVDYMSSPLDADIALAVGWVFDGAMPLPWKAPDSASWVSEPPRFSTSLDATVRPEGDDVFWRSGHDGEGPDPSLFRADVLLSDHARSFTGRARTEPMARRAAELRARAALSQTDAEEAK